MVFEFPTLGIARLAAGAGADFVIFDQEHTGWNVETVKTAMAAARASDIVPMVRPPSTMYHLLSRPLDAGALGLMIPMVESVEQARTIVASAKYPPLGRRGAGLFYEDQVESDFPATLRAANDAQLLIVQIETVAGLEAADEIAAVEGIDVLWVGHGDLTTSLGIPGDWENPRFLAALDRVVACAEASGKPAGIMATSVENARALFDRGFRILVFGDSPVFSGALRDSIAASLAP